MAENSKAAPSQLSTRHLTNSKHKKAKQSHARVPTGYSTEYSRGAHAPAVPARDALQALVRLHAGEAGPRGVVGRAPDNLAEGNLEDMIGYG